MEATGSRTDSEPRPPATARSRPKLYRVYFALAAFDLLTVSLGLYVIDRITRIYTDSVAVNQRWADRLSDYAELSRLAASVNAPGNDVFDTGDVNREAARLAERLDAFEAKAAAVRADLADVEGEAAADLLRAFDAIEPAMHEMVAEANLIFSYFRRGEPERAGRRMAEMDRHYAHVNATLTVLGDRVRAIQRSHFAEQIARASSIRGFEFVIGGLVVVMVVAVTFYGHTLARRMKQSARETEEHLEQLAQSRGELRRHRDHLEELVAARTAELESSHEQLRLAERLASMGTLAAGLGHDMNNVLFPIRCRLDALEQAGLDGEAANEVAGLRQSVDYLQQLSDGLRLLALDPADPDATSGVTRPGAWAREARSLFQTAVPKRATLEWSVAEDLPPVSVAPHRLTQALFNLVVNAGEAIGPDGTVRVWAEALEDRRVVRIGVTDDGAGMSEDVRRRVLEPFFTTKTRGMSTGLGLALVHGVVKGAGGTLDIEAAPGRGTTVAMNLPAAQAAGAETVPSPAARSAVVSVADHRLATLATALLESAGFEVRRGDDPGNGSLWVADAGAASAEAARRYLDGSPVRQVVIIGDGDTPSAQPGVILARLDSAVESIHRAIDVTRTAAAEHAP